MRENVGKRLLLELLDFLRYKVDNDLMTMEDIESLARVIEEHLPLLGTADDFARFYGQSEQNVRTLISRRYIGKPKRRVYFSFNQFRGLIPKSWGKE